MALLQNEWVGEEVELARTRPGPLPEAESTRTRHHRQRRRGAVVARSGGTKSVPTSIPVKYGHRRQRHDVHTSHRSGGCQTRGAPSDGPRHVLAQLLPCVEGRAACCRRKPWLPHLGPSGYRVAIFPALSEPMRNCRSAGFTQARTHVREAPRRDELSASAPKYGAPAQPAPSRGARAKVGS
jgi:hypothetical protein